MDADLKKILKAVVLEMRHELEGYYDNSGKWHPGDLETRLAEIGVRKDRASVPVDELGRLIDEDVRARKIVDAFIDVREQAGVDRAEAVAEYIRESAYTWANRLVALRCMEARELLDDEVIVGREAYGGRSLVHHRLAQASPELCAGEDDGRFAMLAQVFSERAKTLPMLFDPDSPSIALRPSPAALKNCLAWLSGTQKVRSQEPATDAVFAAPDALGWAYQYWNTEEKDRVFETVRTKKGAKIEGADIIPATQLYTEDYMVKFLVQNSLGAIWMGMHPDSKLSDSWEYYIRDADRAPAKKMPLQQITLLDPACGSGHFLLEAFDMLYVMYEEEGSLKDPEGICKSILENNLFGIDIDERSIQIAEASLWMKAEEKSFGFCGANTNLVAATSSHLKGESWERFLTTFEKEPHIPRVLHEFARTIEHIDELGSLARPFEALQEIIKAEHEIWEEQERERLESGNFLFQELRDDLLATQLPFQDISDKEFFDRTMRHALFAIDGFSKDARESGEFNDQLMGAEAKTGFRLLDLLSRKFDIVVANPPYMGSKNMNDLLRSYVERCFKEGKRDLYAAFLLRSLELLKIGGRVAMVTQQAWMFIKSFADLRAIPEDKLNDIEKGSRTGLLRDVKFESLAHLGPNAFEEISGEVVNTVLFVFAKLQPDTDSLVAAFRLTGPNTPTDKAIALRECCRNSDSNLVSKPHQSEFLQIPNAPISYWAANTITRLYSKFTRLSDRAVVKRGISTGKNDRLLRYYWEVPDSGRWREFVKAGGHARWFGLQSHAIDWPRGRVAMNELAGARIQNEKYFDRSGATFSQAGSGSLGVRTLSEVEMYEAKSPGIFAFKDEQIFAHLAILNCRISSWLLRCFSPAIDINEAIVAALPLPNPNEDESVLLRSLSVACINFKKSIVSAFLNERCLEPTQVLQFSREQTYAEEAILATLEGIVEEKVFELFELTEGEEKSVLDETGTPAGWFPIIEGCDDIPFELPDSVTTCVSIHIAGKKLHAISSSERAAYKEALRSLYCQLILDQTDIEETEPGADDSAEEDEIVIGRCVPMPSETHVDLLSKSLKIHPLSVYWLLRDGVVNDGWLSRNEAVRSWSDVASVCLLTMLGHSWHNKSISMESDLDGLFPCSAFWQASDASLFTRLAASIGAVQGLPPCTELLGKSLFDWILNDFFLHHIKQFKKRPIAWLIQSTSLSSRKPRAFSCFVYSHRVDIDTIAKIRTQYSSPLRLRFETEMRGIVATSTTERSDRQAKRAVELEELIAELHAFDASLQSVSSSGFGPESTRPILRQYAFDEAILSMKACWLHRLSVLLKQSPGEESGNGVRSPSPMHGWQDQARRTELHQDLAAWIGEALSHLSYFCSQVGPKAPDAKNLHEDPSNADFGSLIQAEIALMQTGSMKLACGVWWGKFDAAVLAPIRERIKVLKAEQKELNAAIKEDRQPVLVAEQVLDESAEYGCSESKSAVTDMPLLSNHVFEQTIELTKAAMKARLKEVKTKIKKFTEEMDSKAGKAQAIRDAIQAWQLPDPIPASLDFSPSSPNLPALFDQVSSLDERRSPPKTIAEFIAQESMYAPDINDGVRVNIAPLQKARVLAADVLAAKDVDKAIADRAEWRSDERRWVREGKLPQPGWWPEVKVEGGGTKDA